MMLVDSHCHLDFPDFAADLDGVISRAADAGVGTLLTICTHITRFEQVRAVAERFDNVYCTVGIHPHEAGSEPETGAGRLIQLAQHPKVVGLGETGLDFFYDHAPREQQEKAFRAHIEAARQTGLPIIIHTRDADRDMMRILREEAGKGAFPGLIHCFSSSRELAELAIEIGLYISLSGIFTFKTAEPIREIVRGLPLERLLVETDAPFLAPIPLRGKRCEPAFVAHTAKRLAEELGLSPEDLAELTTSNFFRLFKKVEQTRMAAQ